MWGPWDTTRRGINRRNYAGCRLGNIFFHNLTTVYWQVWRFRGAPTLPAQMIPRAWRALSSIGLPQKDSPLPQPSTVGLNWTVASIMNAQEHCCALPILTGPSQRKMPYSPLFAHTNRIHRNKEKLRSGEMHVRGDQWPIFLYADLAFDCDDPWNGLLRNQLLVIVCVHFNLSCIHSLICPWFQAYKHVFTSPSSVDIEEPMPTKSGNARIHGMKEVTKASIAYIATQVRLSYHTTASVRFFTP